MKYVRLGACDYPLDVAIWHNGTRVKCEHKQIGLIRHSGHAIVTEIIRDLCNSCDISCDDKGQSSFCTKKEDLTNGMEKVDD